MKLNEYGKISWVYFYKNEKRTRRLYKGHINPEDLQLEYELQGIVWETHGRQVQINQYNKESGTWNILPSRPMYK